MKRTLLLTLALTLASPALSAKEATPLLKDREANNLSELFADYFRARSEEDYKGMTKTFEKLTKQLDSTAKSKKVESLLVSPIDLRSVFSAPIQPEKSPKKGFLVEKSVEVPLVAGQVMKVDYLLQLPRGYKHDDPTPCLLVLPPPVERLDQLKKWVQRAYPSELTEQAMIIVPLNHERKVDWISDEGRQLAFFALVDAYQHHHVDRLKLFLEGHGSTGAAVVDFASALPTLFSGAIVRGLDQAPETTLIGNAEHLPFLLLSAGEADAKKLVSDFADEAKAKGVTAEVVDAQIDESGEVDTGAMTKLAEFVAGTVKAVAPKRVSLTVPTPLQTNGYWFRLSDPAQEFDPEKPLIVKAEVSSETNEFVITTPPNVLGFTIYLNDDLVDMGKPIKVTLAISKDDGAPESKVVFEGTKARNLEFALQSWFLNISGNLGEVYTNAIDIEVPQ